MLLRQLILCGLLPLSLVVRGESLVSNYSLWKYFEGTQEASDPLSAWRGLGFDDTHWIEDRSGFSNGYGRYDAPTTLSGMSGKYHTLFLRKKFILEDSDWIQSLVMRVDYRDGFVAYLNGTEVARRGLAGEPGQFVPFNALAALHYRGDPELVDLNPFIPLLQKGENILAIQAHDDSINGYGFAFHVELLANITRGPFIQSTTTTSTKIAWQTLKPTTSVVEYGPTAALGQRVQREMLTTDHVLQLLDLKPNTIYHYRVGGVAGETLSFSKATSFRTLKLKGPTRLMLLGDSGSGNLLQHKFAKVIRDNQPDAVLYAGDIVYDFKPGPPSYYTDFRHFSVYKEHMKSVPFFTAIGNHELYYGHSAYLNAFHTPTNNLPTLGLKPPNINYRYSGTEHFYSFDVGDAHVAVLFNPWYSHHNFSKDTNQLHWLTNDLATTKKPWKFLLGHFPVASSSGHGWSSYDGNALPDTVDFGNTIYPIVAKYGVDMMLAGHAHSFEKFNPVHGMISVVCGSSSSTYGLSRFFPGTSQFWGTGDNFVARISINGDQLKLEGLDKEGKVLDWLVINRKMPERDVWDAAWHTPQIESPPNEGGDKNLQGQVFDLIGEPIPAINGASANLGQVRVNNDRTHLYIGFEQTMIGPNHNIFLFIGSPRQEGVSSLKGLGNGKLDNHRIGVRFKDESGNWRVTQYVGFRVQNGELKLESDVVGSGDQLTDSQWIAAEYFINDDPGEGSGTALEAKDGAFDSLYEEVSLSGIDISGLEVGEGADGLDFLQNLIFSGFRPSIAAILGDETIDGQSRNFSRPGLNVRRSTGENPEDFEIVPFPLGQGVFQLDQTFSDVTGARIQQFNRSPQLNNPMPWRESNFYENDANFVELGIEYSALGGLRPGDEVTIAAVVGSGSILTDPKYQYRQLDSTHLGKSLKADQYVLYQLEGLKVRLANDPDPDDDGLLTDRELELGTDPAKPDTDGDLLPDGWEITRGLDPLKHDGVSALAYDPDNDGMNNGDELSIGTDPAKPDTDGDLLPDGWELAHDLDPLKHDGDDPDKDGLLTARELELDTDPIKPDTDGDLLPDGWEIAHGLDPLKHDGDDPDKDGLLTARELELGTNPAKPDTDGDLLPDGWEVRHNLDPLKHDGDSALAHDPDGDGMSNSDELAVGTDPLNADSSLKLRVELTANSIRLYWHAVPDADYQLLKADILQGPFQPFGKTQKLEDQAATEMDLILPRNQIDKRAKFFKLEVTPKE